MSIHAIVSDWSIFQIVTEIFIQFIHLCYAANVFAVAKFLVKKFRKLILE